MPKLPKYTWESCLSDIFVLSSIGKAWEKNKRHNSYKTGGQTLYGSHLKFILPTSSLRYHLFCDPNFYCHITICLTYFPIRKQKYQKYFSDLGLSHGEKKKKRDSNLRKAAFCTKSLKVNLERRSLLVAFAPAKLNCG